MRTDGYTQVLDTAAAPGDDAGSPRLELRGQVSVRAGAMVGGDTGSAKGTPARIETIPYQSFVGKLFLCLDPDSLHIGETVKVCAHGCAHGDPVIAQVISGGWAGGHIIIERAVLVAHYMECDRGNS